MATEVHILSVFLCSISFVFQPVMPWKKNAETLRVLPFRSEPPPTTRSTGSMPPLPPPTFSPVFSIGPCQEALYSNLSTPELLRSRYDAETRGGRASTWRTRARWRATWRRACTRRCCAGAARRQRSRCFRTRIQLKPGEYEIKGDEEDEKHNTNWQRLADELQWGGGYGPLHIAPIVVLTVRGGSAAIYLCRGAEWRASTARHAKAKTWYG